MSTIRPELPPMPSRIEKLYVHRGYPVPWFVAWIDDDQTPLPRGQGTPDFRVLYPGAIADAHKYQRCWVCGERRGAYHTFVVGPMCAVNRVSAEPPSHHECAEWSVKACPWLSRPHAVRRERNMPVEAAEAAGIPILRNPGVTLMWTTRKFWIRKVPNGFLFNIGEPEDVQWIREGRPATREEVEESVNGGLPILREYAEMDGPIAVAEFERYVARAELLYPIAA